MTLSRKIYSWALGFLLLHLLQAASGQTFVVGDKEYRVVTSQKVNWYRAFQMCSAFGMRLASIEKESDLKELRDTLFSASLLTNSYWLGGNNLANRAEYIWLSSGTKFVYTKWAASQPGTAANRCVRSNYNFDWVTDGCNSLNYFICSKPVVPDCGAYGQCSDGLTYLYEY